MQVKDLIVWDLETTGFVDDADSHILEIGAMVVKDGIIISRHNWVLNHGIEIPAKITEITEIDQKVIDEYGRSPYLSIKEFVGLFTVHGPINLTHNGLRFDLPFLAKELSHTAANTEEKVEAAIDLINILTNYAIDTAAIYKGKKLGLIQAEGESFADYGKRVLDTKMFGLKYNVGACCDELGIDRTGIKQHRALADVELTYEIYKKLTA